jgi:hypothetical protein
MIRFRKGFKNKWSREAGKMRPESAYKNTWGFPHGFDPDPTDAPSGSESDSGRHSGNHGLFGFATAVAKQLQVAQARCLCGFAGCPHGANLAEIAKIAQAGCLCYMSLN